jgi:serine/threonine protein kinase
MIVEEFCDKGTLHDFAFDQQQKYKTEVYWSLIRNLFKQLARGLAKLHHEEEICLLNLSLRKVLLDSNLCPKFFDFSCAEEL